MKVRAISGKGTGRELSFVNNLVFGVYLFLRTKYYTSTNAYDLHNTSTNAYDLHKLDSGKWPRSVHIKTNCLLSVGIVDPHVHNGQTVTTQIYGIFMTPY